MPVHGGARLLASEAARDPATLIRPASAMHFHTVECFARLEEQLCESGSDLQAGPGAFQHAVLPEMPGTPYAVFAVTTQHVGHLDDLPARVEDDFPPVHHRIVEPLVAIVLADEALPIRP